MSAERCPECGAAAGRCACGATAAGFDHLRIRPYMSHPGAPGDEDPTAPPRLLGVVQTPEAQPPPPAAMWAGPPSPYDHPGGGYGHPDPYTPAPQITDETIQLQAIPAAPAPGPAPVRRRKGLPLAIGAAVVALGAAALAAGLLSNEGNGESNRVALPDPKLSAPELNPLPDTAPPSTTEDPAVPPSAEPSASASASATPSPSASATTGPSPSASASRRPTASPTPSTTASPSPTTSPRPPQGAVLQRGDTGAEVKELQQRLSEMWMYWGPSNGKYGRSVETAVADYQRWANITADPPGVYGPETRRMLEAQSHEP